MSPSVTRNLMVRRVEELETSSEARGNMLNDFIIAVVHDKRSASRSVFPPTVYRDRQVVDVREQRKESQEGSVGWGDIMQLEGIYRCARKLCEAALDRLFIETVKFARMNSESVQLGQLETI